MQEEPVVQDNVIDESTDEALDINGLPVPSEEVEVNHFDKYFEDIDPAITENRDALLNYMADASVEMSTGPLKIDGVTLLRMKNEFLSNYGHDEIPLDFYTEVSTTSEEDGPMLHQNMLRHE